MKNTPLVPPQSLPSVPPPNHGDFLQKYLMAEMVENATLTLSHQRPAELTYFTGGRTRGEQVPHRCIDFFVSEKVTDGVINIKSMATFLERLEIDPKNYFKYAEELTTTTPYNFVTKYSQKIQHTRDDNTIINLKTKTVLKFLRSKDNVKGFLLSLYLCSAYNDSLGLAKCVAYYPTLMCAEYVHAGENVNTVIKRSPAEYGFVYDQIEYILRKIKHVANMEPATVEPYNFCIDLSNNKVTMTCVEWLVPCSYDYL